MRQQTKKREHIEHHVGGQIFWRHASHWNDQAPSLDKQRAEARRIVAHCGGKVVRVTRYRLAPLIELSAWEQTPGFDQWTIRQPDVHCVVAADHRCQGHWFAFLNVKSHVVSEDALSSVRTEVRWQVNGFDSVIKARAACEERLRELGFRVARNGGAA